MKNIIKYTLLVVIATSLSFCNKDDDATTPEKKVRLKSFTNDTDTYPITYTAKNQLASIGFDTYNYNTDGQLINDGERTYTYNSKGQISSMKTTYSNKVINAIFIYNDQNLLSKASFSFVRDEIEQITRTYTYNGNKQLILFKEEINSRVKKWLITYDANGNISKIVKTEDGMISSTTTYTYDDKKNPNHQLLKAAGFMNSELSLFGLPYILFKGRISFGDYSIFFELDYLSKNNLISSESDYFGVIYTDTYTYAYNESGYPETAIFNKKRTNAGNGNYNYSENLVWEYETY